MKRFRSENASCQDAEILRRFFQLKIDYVPKIPLQPDAIVDQAHSEEVLKGFEALDNLFYDDIDRYMNRAALEIDASQMSPSKAVPNHLATGFEELDREYYGILDNTANINSLAACSSNEDKENAYSTSLKPRDVSRSALLDLMESDSDDEAFLRSTRRRL